ncbi:hypothetical protein ASE27_01220 [Oerskovia sp. Root918]|uniref:hypothetical protein n=1 Tax=Oerskovia sp. Root22 TaxID=1736494 RepID=UPI000702266E|nr:hypothetical protein [Oerskovia sp. Root22]KRC42799.1 hypothetical protein ASE15_01965 [Oerskovia sp. Root22]KRD47065.1 hypothetical protein ASE27_01220 [Oerskovia sp. Root918]
MPVLPPPARPSVGLLGAGVALVLLTGCTGTGATAAPAVPSVAVREPVTTRAEADTLFAGLTSARNTANAARDAAALSLVETGPSLRASTFAYAAQVAQGAAPVAPYTSTAGALAAPERGTADWFYSLSAPGDTAVGDTTGEYVESTFFTRAGEGDPWLLTYRLATDPAVALPQPALSGGSAVVPDGDARARGDLALQDVVAYASTGQPAPALDVTDADQLATAHTQGFPLPDLSPDAGTEQRACTLEEPAPAWASSTRGIFAMASVECTQSVALTGGWTAPTPTTGTIGTVPVGARLSGWTVSQSVTVLVEVHDDGTSRVVGSGLRPVRTDVTPAP